MAKATVKVKVAGGDEHKKEASTIEELAQLCGIAGQGYKAQVDGEEVDYDFFLEDFSFVTFTKPVKANDIYRLPKGCGGFRYAYEV